MTHDTLLKLIVVLTREVARLRGDVAANTAVTEELRLLDQRLASVDAAQIQIDGVQQFYENLERPDPAFAALIDKRVPRDFDTGADPKDRFDS